MLALGGCPFASLMVSPVERSLYCPVVCLASVFFAATALVLRTIGCIQKGIWTLRSLTVPSFIWNRFLCLGWNKSQESCFSTWVFSWPSIIYYKGHHFLSELQRHHHKAHCRLCGPLCLLGCYNGYHSFSPGTTTLSSKIWSSGPLVHMSIDLQVSVTDVQKATYTRIEEQISSVV